MRTNKRKTGKAGSLLFVMPVVLILAGCGARAENSTHSDASRPDMIEQIAQKREENDASSADTSAVAQFPEAAVTAPEPALTDPALLNGAIDLEPLPESDVDVDLTKMNSTMVYARVLNLLTNPETYVGMSVRMQGKLALYVDPETQAHYFACIIADATACCAQGIEFERDGDYRYPEDYPALDEEVVVEGIFEIYEENGLRYVHLTDADMQLATEPAKENG